MWELDGPILYWNHGAELLYGYSKEQAVGQISQKLLKTERPVSPAAFTEALKRDGEWIGDIQHTTRDGRRLVVESRHQLLIEADGHEYVLETCRDITERLELEDGAAPFSRRVRAAGARSRHASFPPPTVRYAGSHARCWKRRRRSGGASRASCMMRLVRR